jgi:outer membrane protein TolC
MKCLIFFFGLFFGCVWSLNAQSEVFDFETFKLTVSKFHPLIQKAKNLELAGNGEVLKALGGFDPTISSNVNQKTFNGKEYYWTSNTTLKIPIWFGTNLKAGYEDNRGYYVGDDIKTPGSGLWYAGVEIPLMQGFLYNERQFQLQQAQNLQQMSVAERQLAINDLLLDAFSTYWTWTEAYKKLMIAKEGFVLAEARYKAAKEQVEVGENPPIDTVEALILLENRTVENKSAQTQFQNATLLLQTFLWADGNQLVSIPANVIPQLANTNPEVGILNANDIDSLPSIQLAAYKVDQIALDVKWKEEQLKPSINANYNLLNQPSGNLEISQFSMQNYKFGVTAYVPLFLRKERGGVKLAKLKMENAGLDLRAKKREYDQKIKNLANEIELQTANIVIQKRIVAHTRTLRTAELDKFQAGESSLFMINSREQTYLSSENKLVELEIKLEVSKLKMKWLLNKL